MMFKRSKKQKASAVHSMGELHELADTGRPILVDFYQHGCAPCQVMDGIIDEVAAEFGEGANVVKINVAKAPWAVEAFKIRSTPTFVVLAAPRQKGAKPGKFNQRWRQTGLVKKDALHEVLVQAGGEALAS